MKYILCLFLLGMSLTTKAEELPEPFRVGNFIGIKATVLYDNTFRIKEIKGKWIHLMEAPWKKDMEEQDMGWWNTDMILQVVNKSDPTVP